MEKKMDRLGAGTDEEGGNCDSARKKWSTSCPGYLKKSRTIKGNWRVYDEDV